MYVRSQILWECPVTLKLGGVFYCNTSILILQTIPANSSNILFLRISRGSLWQTRDPLKQITLLRYSGDKQDSLNGLRYVVQSRPCQTDFVCSNTCATPKHSCILMFDGNIWIFKYFLHILLLQPFYRIGSDAFFPQQTYLKKITPSGAFFNFKRVM